MIPAIDKYEKLVDDIYQLNYNSILRFNVILNKKLNDGRRYSFHHEYEYKSDKYIDQDRLITLKRTFDFYLSLENIKPDERGIKEFIMIKPQNIILVRQKLNEATNWFTNSNLFAYDKTGKMIMLGKVNPIQILGLPMDKYISLEPVIMTYNDNTSFESGIRIYMSSNENYIDLSIDRFMALVYFINSINMYESAQLLLNYVRPELGTNLYNFNSTPVVDEFVEPEVEYTESKSKGRKIQNSFFDKLDNM